LEIEVMVDWGGGASGLSVLADVVTFDANAVALGQAFTYGNAVKNFVSAVQSLAPPAYTNVVAGTASSLSPPNVTGSLGLSASFATLGPRFTKMYYPVQPADVIDGWVHLALIAASSGTTAFTLSPGAQLQGDAFWSVRKAEPSNLWS
jgi:hypothetical protein